MAEIYMRGAEVPVDMRHLFEEVAGGGMTDVFCINPQGYSEAHFATFPEALVRPCILAGTSERGACSECGAPWQRVAERSKPPQKEDRPTDYCDSASTHGAGGRNLNGKELAAWRASQPTPAVTWEPTCPHAEAPTVPCLVLDPFAGSGTTLAVAVRLGRSAVGIELSPKYAKLARKRVGRAAADVGAGGTVTIDEDGLASQLGLFA